MVLNNFRKQRVLDHVDIVDYINLVVPLKRRCADTWTGLCPFHEEQTPSFNVHRKEPYFKCFGCGRGGDIFAFVMTLAQCGFLEALETLEKNVPPDAVRTMERMAQANILAVCSIFDRVQAGYRAMFSRVLSGYPELCVSRGSLERLGVGWDGEALTFPMRNEDGEIVGIRRRLPDGKKLSVRGGREGCFVPTGTMEVEPVVYVTEGPTDTAAALDLGLYAIGRPSCNGGGYIISRLTANKAVVIVSDNDTAGHNGAVALRRLIEPYCRWVRVVMPPCKDLRRWLIEGATHNDVVSLPDALEPPLPF